MAAASPCPEAALRGLRPYGVVALPQCFGGTKFALQSFWSAWVAERGPLQEPPELVPNVAKHWCLFSALKTKNMQLAGHRRAVTPLATVKF